MLDCAGFARGPRAPEIVSTLYAKGHWLNYDWKLAHDALTKIFKTATVSPAFRRNLLELWTLRPDGPSLQAEGPGVQLNVALYKLGWQFDPTGAFLTAQGDRHPWTREPGLMQHAVRDELRASALVDVALRRPNMLGVDQGVHRQHTLLLADSLEDYPQDVAVLRHLHTGSIRWGRAAAAAKHQPTWTCLLCDTGHDSAQHLFFECGCAQVHRAAWFEADALISLAPPCLKFHALVPAGAPDAGAYKRALVSLQALQLQCLQTRRLARTAWQKLEGLRANEYAKMCPIEQLLRVREAQRDPPPPRPPSKPPPPPEHPEQCWC